MNRAEAPKSRKKDEVKAKVTPKGRCLSQCSDRARGWDSDWGFSWGATAMQEGNALAKAWKVADKNAREVVEAATPESEGQWQGDWGEDQIGRLSTDTALAGAFNVGSSFQRTRSSFRESGLRCSWETGGKREREEREGGGLLGGLHSEVLMMMGISMKRTRVQGGREPFGEPEAPFLYAVTCGLKKRARRDNICWCSLAKKH